MLYSVCGIHISYSVITAQLSPFKPTLSAHLATIHCRGGLNLPECIKQTIIGRIQCAPTANDPFTQMLLPP